MIGSTQLEQQYDLRGLNMVTPDQIIDDSAKTKGQSPFATNARIFLPTDEESPRTSIQSRKGAGFYTIPVGEAVTVSITAVTGQTDRGISATNQVAQKFTAADNNALSAIELLLKTNTSTDVIRVDVYTDSSGALGSVIASTSIQGSQLTSSYTYVKARFPQAPLLTNGQNYWIVIYGQETVVTGTYYLSANTTGTNVLQTSIDQGQTWTLAATGSINFKISTATSGSVRGQYRFTNKNGLKQTLFAHGTSIYQVTNESTGTVTAIQTGLTAATTRVRFIPVYDKVAIITGLDNVYVWDGTTMTTQPTTATFAIPDNMIIFHDRAWYYSRTDPTKLYFSNLYPDLYTIPAVNYQYVPDTASPDPITGLTKFQDQLVIFTKESKYLLLGDSVSTLGLSQSPGGTKGAVSQEAISNGETRVYFYSIDGGAYYYDGAQDIPIGDPIQPEQDQITSIADIDSIVTEKEWRIYYKTNGDLMHRKMLVYDLRYKEWMIDTETYTRLPISWSQEGNELVEASSTLGALYFGEIQDTQVGAPIEFKYWTNYKKYTSGIAKDRVKTFRAVYATPDRTITVQVGKDADFNNEARYKDVILTSAGIVYDGGEVFGSLTALYGKGTKVSQPKISLSGRAFNTQYRFEKEVCGTEIRIYGYEAMIASGRAR